jgi:hypothetical protein
VEIYNSEFYNNVANDTPNEEGFSGSSLGIFVNDGEINATIVNNTFAFNKDYGTFSPQNKGTLALRRLSDDNLNILNAEIHNNIFYQNEDSIGKVNINSVGLLDRPTNPINLINFTHNNSEQNNFGTISSGGTVEDNIDLNPEFIDGSNGDFTLLPSSPMIDAGENAQLPSSITEDIAGNTRIDNSFIDLGANESCSISLEITEINGVLSAGVYDSYQWYLDGNIIMDSTSQTYTPSQNGDYTVEVTEGNCIAISDVFTVTDVDTTGIETSIQSEAFTSLHIYPNPTNGELNIDIDEAIHNVKLMNLQGQTVLNNISDKTININHLNTGIYFLEITNQDNLKVIRKIIKK